MNFEITEINFKITHKNNTKYKNKAYIKVISKTRKK
jgi:hypothetical protein